MFSAATFTTLLSLAVLTIAAPHNELVPRACTGTISSINDVAAAVKCTTININAFTVPAGVTFDLKLLDNTVVNMLGDVTFGYKEWNGPLFQVTGNGITFNGNSHYFDGNGPLYWDGLGSNSGKTKPHPMMKIKMSGNYNNVNVRNSPAQVYSFGNPAAVVMNKLIIDNSFGDAPNANSNGKPAAHNTDGFDVSSHDVTIQYSVIKNQDDCIAINKGTNIVFKGNSCSGGHGISIGSIQTGSVVDGVTVTGNKITNNTYGLRIKTVVDATGASVKNVVYSDNTGSGITKGGVLVDQSYPKTLSTPGNGVTISGVTFSGTNTIAVASSAQRVAVNCGKGSCTGTWNWSGLKVTGGKASTITNASITGGSFL